jgi:hypothetical protein
VQLSFFPPLPPLPPLALPPLPPIPRSQRHRRRSRLSTPPEHCHRLPEHCRSRQPWRAHRPRHCRRCRLRPRHPRHPRCSSRSGWPGATRCRTDCSGRPPAQRSAAVHPAQYRSSAPVRALTRLPYACDSLSSIRPEPPQRAPRSDQPRSLVRRDSFAPSVLS